MLQKLFIVAFFLLTLSLLTLLGRPFWKSLRRFYTPRVFPRVAYPQARSPELCLMQQASRHSRDFWRSFQSPGPASQKLQRGFRRAKRRPTIRPRVFADSPTAPASECQETPGTCLTSPLLSGYRSSNDSQPCQGRDRPLQHVHLREQLSRGMPL